MNESSDLLRLPELVARKVLECTDLLSIFKLAQSSRLAHQFVRRCEIRVYAVAIEFQHGECQEVFVQRTKGVESIRFYFSSNQDPVVRLYNLNDHLLAVVDDDNVDSNVRCRSQDFDTDATALVEYLATLFELKTTHLLIEPSSLPHINRLSNNQLFNAKLTTLVLFGTEVPYGRWLAHARFEDVEQLLRRFPQVKWLRLGVEFGRSSFPQFYNYKHLFYPDSLTELSDLLSMRCKTVKLTGSRLSYHHLNTFLLHWLAGHNHTLRMFLDYVHEEADFRLDIVLQNIPTQPWSASRRNRFFRVKSPMEPDELFDCSEGRDMIRSDGTVATVLLKDSFFGFYVFHRPFE